MTWWDHETGSIWSQPWRLAIGGELEGTRLRQAPGVIVPWATWLVEHPDTLVLRDRRSGFSSLRQNFTSDYVIGIALGQEAKAYPFKETSDAGAVNDRLGSYPVLVIADPETKFVDTFFRVVGEAELEFTLVEDKLVNTQTGSAWDVTRGIAVSGLLRGQVLQQVPTTPPKVGSAKTSIPTPSSTGAASPGRRN